jgi:uncharacterized RDD family membrane protein YckC
MQATFDQAVAIPEGRAGWWRRFAAFLVDAIILGVVDTILSIAFGRTVEYSVGWLISLAYFTFFHGRTGQTPGNAALGLRVIDFRSGTVQAIGYPRAALRWLVSIPSAIVIFIGYFWMLWDSEKQTWHDKAAGSVVVRTDDI